MTPGCLLLANAGESFTCGHEHGTGDRCLSFSYTEEFLERFAARGDVDASRFTRPRLAPMRALSPVIAKASEFLERAHHAKYEELGIQVLARATQLGCGPGPVSTEAPPSALARVTRVVRMIDNDPEVPQDLNSLAQVARLSPYHFLRTFRGLTGTTPHQYLLRRRLRRAAIRLRTEPAKVLDIALGCGFSDVSNFNRAFRDEFGVSPRVYRSSV